MWSAEVLQGGRPALGTDNLVYKNRETIQEHVIFAAENIPRRFVGQNQIAKILDFWEILNLP